MYREALINTLNAPNRICSYLIRPNAVFLTLQSSLQGRTANTWPKHVLSSPLIPRVPSTWTTTHTPLHALLNFFSGNFEKYPMRVIWSLELWDSGSLRVGEFGNMSYRQEHWDIHHIVSELLQTWQLSLSLYSTKNGCIYAERSFIFQIQRHDCFCMLHTHHSPCTFLGEVKQNER